MENLNKTDIIDNIHKVMCDVGCTSLSSKAGRYISIWYDRTDGKCYVKNLAGIVKELHGLSEKELEKIYKDISADFS